MIYLDYAATVPVLPEVEKTMQEATKHFFANASALHTPGHLAMNAVENARTALAQLINCDPEEIIFTSGSTESNNTVLHIFEGYDVAISEIEHHSILEPAKAYAQSVTPVKVDKNGKVCYNEKIGAKSPKLYSIGMVNNELGTVQDLAFWSKIAHQNSAYIHSDMTQALGKIPIDVKELDLDYATFSAHKIGGPVGVGALYVKKNAPFKPFLLGGNQESKRRGGTYNVVGIAGFGAAIEYVHKNQTWQKLEQDIKPLRDYLADEILTKIPGSSLNSNLESCLPNFLNVSFEAAEGESIQLYLDAEGIIVSTGSACAAGDLKPSHVLMATANDAEVAHSSIRFSLGLDTTKAEIDEVMTKLPGIIQKLQGMSTIKMKGAK